MDTRKLGRQGLEVSALGLGCMGMSWAYGRTDDAESTRVLHRAIDLGVTFWDTAEVYGPFTNEALIGRALNGKRRDAVVIATKFAFRFGPNGEMAGLDSSPAHVKRAVEGSLKRLGTDYIDLYYQHRLDPNTPIEDTVGALSDLVNAGKVRYIGLSEVGPGTIRRAHAVHPLTAVQTEYSLWERGVEDKVLPMLRQLGIGLVAYSPVGRGMLTGRIKSPADFDAVRLPAHASPVRRGEPAPESRSRRDTRADRISQSRHAGATRARVAPEPRHRHRADPGDEACAVSRRERGCRRPRSPAGGMVSALESRCRSGPRRPAPSTPESPDEADRRYGIVNRVIG